MKEPCKFHQPFQYVAMWFNLILYFCGVIKRVCAGRTHLVKWLDFAHNNLIFTYKVTKNLSLGQF